MFTLAISFDHFQFALIHEPNIPGSYAILFFTALDLASITSHIRGQGQRLRVPGCDGAGTAERSYPASEVTDGGREELSRVRGQGRLGGDSLHQRSGVAGRNEARAGSREEKPEERWLRRRRRA